MDRRVGVTAIVSAILYALPLFAFAETPSLCPITRTLTRGSSGADVTALQIFLKDQSFLATTPTGYFGTITEASLARWQLHVGLVATLRDGGVYGARSRAYVKARWCAAAATTAPMPNARAQCIPPERPTLSCSGTWQQIFSASGCHIGWTCVANAQVAVENRAPTISAIVGPTTVSLNETGTWRITASDPDGDTIRYSTVFGDEGTNVSQLLNIAQEGTTYTDQTSFSHAYKESGSYTIVVFAKDGKGNISKATISVMVPSPPPPPPISTSTAGGGAGSGGTSSGNTSSASGGVTISGTTCTYKGQSYAEGQNVTVPNPSSPGATLVFICDNATWLWTNVNPNSPSYALYNGSDVCWVAGAVLLPPAISDFGCNVSTNTSGFGMIPRHGRAPFATSVTVAADEIGSQLLGAITINWGDGSTGGVGQHPPVDSQHIETYSHTYSASGSYTVTIQWQSLTGDKTSSGKVRVDP